MRNEHDLILRQSHVANLQTIENITDVIGASSRSGAIL
jgi:hypothetical protein